MARSEADAVDHHWLVDADTVTRFTALRDAAIGFAQEASAARDGEVHVRFGEAGRAACAEDIGFHLDFLQAALATRNVSLFTGYLAWVAQVLGRRGVPLGSVVRCVDDLAAFYGRRLGAMGAPIVAILVAGKASLTGGLVASGFDTPCPVRWREVAAYSAAALRGNRREAIAHLDHALAREGLLPLVAVHVIQPAMYDVGRLWQQNGASVVQEHFTTALSQSWMAHGMARAKAAPGNGRRMLFGCLPENRHVLGMRMVADAFELGGWTTFDIGPQPTADTIAARIRAVRPHLVGFSASLPRHLVGLRQVIRDIRDILAAECPRIVIGGLAINQFPPLASWMGAEVLGFDAVSAVAAAEALVGD